MELRDLGIPAADLPQRLAALPGWQGDTSGISRDHPIGWDAAVTVASQLGPWPSRWRTGPTWTSAGPDCASSW
jgi:hypothetical protein